MTAESDYYPGTKTPKRSVIKKQDELEGSAGWDAKPSHMDVNGEVVEVFSIGALAHALQRKQNVIRDWERFLTLDGLTYMPQPVLKKDARPKTGPNDKVQQNRIYTRAEIEGYMQIAQEEGLFEANSRIGRTKFPERAHALRNDISDKYRRAKK